MAAKTSETDKQILARIMAEPTFQAVKDAAIRESRKREQEIRDALRNAVPDPPEPKPA